MLKFIFALAFFTSIISLASGKLLSANTSSEQDILRLEMNFDQLIDSNSVITKFNNKTISLTLPEVYYKKNFPQLDAKTSFIKALNFKDFGDKLVSIEIEFTEINAQQMKENIAIESIGKTLIVEVLPPTIQSFKPIKEISTHTEPSKNIAINSVNLDSTNQSDIEKDATNTITNDESKIPLFEAKKEQKSDDTGLTKIALMIIALLGLGGFGIWQLKNKTKMINGPDSLMKIKMITQFHLGPKKSLAVIRVAGESLLLSITDTQISLIKTLSLLDDDLPELTPNDFAQSLDEEVRPRNSKKTSSEISTEFNQNDEEFSFGPAVKTSLSAKIPLLRKIV